ncbi:DNA cytosine methyltransferase [Sinorhizobium meliloti]|uniref:DNA cytosine methyltransferase n=1 Tax=Rhizobium meliloti TaxID=382 RepID=UPI001F160265|nr:DNA cytosine methyltransferase [Sinorhizobium meliloti]
MRPTNYSINPSFGLDNRMTIVLFAGMGGGCDGLEEAGFHVHLAINHDPVAIAVHQKRHPHTRHERCDVFEVCPIEATQGRGVRVLHASPDCTHFSVAKGGKPVSKRRRSLAWVVCRWAGQVRPETITLENVPEIQTWGPLIAKRDPATGRVMKLDGTIAAKGERVPVRDQWLIPDPRKRGQIWRAWLKHMHSLGYSFEGRVLVCADYGIPTIRKRFFGIAQADGRPIEWPVRTHAPRHLAKSLGLKPWVGAHTIIDWSMPVKSIFGRKKALADATMRRTARGVMRYVVDAAKPFIVPITHSGGDRVHCIEEPLRTLTTAHRGELAVVAPTVQAYYGGEQGSRRRGDVEEPLQTFVTEPRHALVAAHLQRQFGRSTGSGVEEPARTFESKGKTALVSAFLAQHNSDPRNDGRKISRRVAVLMSRSHRSPRRRRSASLLPSWRSTIQVSLDGKPTSLCRPSSVAAPHKASLQPPCSTCAAQTNVAATRWSRWRPSMPEETMPDLSLGFFSTITARADRINRSRIRSAP